MRIIGPAAAIAAALIVVAAPVAGAASRDVDLGIPTKSQKAFMPTGTDVNAFFPRTATVNVGDKVRFVPTGFHNLDLPKRGGKLTALLTGGAAIAGSVDAAGTPFWFNGQPAFNFNPVLLSSNYGKSFSYTGAKGIQSGLPLGNKLKPVTVRFQKAGTFTYYCDVHAGMKGTVKVLAKGRKVPSLAAHKKAVSKQVAAALKTAKALPNTTVATNQVYLGASGAGGVELFAMLPEKRTVAVGTTITFRMSPGSYDVHSALFGPGNPETAPTSYLGQIAKSFESPAFDQKGVYPSEAPGSTATLSPTLHGNGFWTSGVLDTSKGTPIPASGKLTFGAPGTYDYYCVIHPFMHGQVVVQ